MSTYSNTVLNDNPVAYWRFSDAPDVNFIVDPSFESGSLTNVQTVWDLGTPAEFTYATGQDDFVTGTAGLKVTTTRTAAGWNSCVVHTGLTIGGSSDIFPVIPGEQYYMSCWMKQSAGAKGTHYKVTWFNSSGVGISNYQVLPGHDGLTPWTYFSGTWTVPVGAVYAQLAVMFGYWDGVTGSNAQIWFDNIQFSPITTYRAIASSWSQPLTSPGFEGNNLDWISNSVGTGANSFDTTSPRSGTIALKLTNPSSGNYGRVYNRVGIPLLGATSVKVAVWIKGTSTGTTGPLRITLAGPGTAVSNSGYATALPSGQSGVGVFDLNPTITTSYTQYTNTINSVDLQYRWLFVELSANGNGATGAVFWDDLTVVLFPSMTFNNGFDARIAGFVSQNATGATNDGDKAVVLDGSTAYLVTNTGPATISGSFSVEGWINPASLAGSNMILSTRAGGGTDNTFDMKVLSSGGIHGDIGDGTGWLTTGADYSAAGIATGSWYHIVYVVNPNGYTIYLNGIPKATGSFSGNPVLLDNTHKIFIGSYNGTAEFCNGTLDEIAIYNYALTPSQVIAHFSVASTLWTANTTNFHVTGNNVTTLFDTVDVATTEIYPYQVNVSSYLKSNDTISSISQVLVNAATGQTAPTGWQGTITVSGGIITTPMTCSVLQKNNQYQISTTFTANANKVLTFTTLINVVA